MTTFLAQHYLDEIVQRTSDETAISCGGHHLSYKSLFRQSNKLAHCLISNGIKRHDRVVFCLTRSEQCVLSILAILKADAIYVPLDHASPQERWQKIIYDCAPKAVLCDKVTFARIKQLSSRTSDDINTVVLDNDKSNYTEKEYGDFITWAQIDGESDERPEYQNIDTDIAYIMYTSGSTGNPKGVMISHLNITNYINWAVDFFRIRQDDNILNTAPFHFDMSTFDIYCSLKSGARLSIAQDSQILFPTVLMKYIEEERITVWKTVPSLLIYIDKLGGLKKGQLHTLNKILFGGETLPTKYLIKWMNMHPDKEYFNVYGPTEATGISVCYHVPGVPPSESDPIPIGKPCANTDVVLLNSNGFLSKNGEVGEICIRGSSISRGYWNDIEKIKIAFIQNPISDALGDRLYKTNDLSFRREDGNLVFVGRKDDQIKYMGYRIQLDEIEHELLAIGGVEEACVVLNENARIGMDELVSFLKVHDGTDESTIVDKLNKQLPAYMVPKRICFVQSIPRNANGKIDRNEVKKLCGREQDDKN